MGKCVDDSYFLVMLDESNQGLWDIVHWSWKKGSENTVTFVANWGEDTEETVRISRKMANTLTKFST